jgi:hypothetical protein
MPQQIRATQEFVVPKSIPIILLIISSLKYIYYLEKVPKVSNVSEILQPIDIISFLMATDYCHPVGIMEYWVKSGKNNCQ